MSAKGLEFANVEYGADVRFCLFVNVNAIWKRNFLRFKIVTNNYTAY